MLSATHFQKGPDVQERKQEVRKLSPLFKWRKTIKRVQLP